MFLHGTYYFLNYPYTTNRNSIKKGDLFALSVGMFLGPSSSPTDVRVSRVGNEGENHMHEDP